MDSVCNDMLLLYGFEPNERHANERDFRTIGVGNTKLHMFIPNSVDRIQLEGERELLLLGEVFYINDRRGNAIKITQDDHSSIKRHICNIEPEKINRVLEGQYIGVYLDVRRKILNVFGDFYQRVDLFYYKCGENLIISTNLREIFTYINPEYSNLMLSHLVSVYGWYVPKGKTIYDNVSRLDVRNVIEFQGGKVRISSQPEYYHKIEKYDDSNFEEYEKILSESIVFRASRCGENWVCTSNGWDSSILLGKLTECFGREKTRSVTARISPNSYTDKICDYRLGKNVRIAESLGLIPEVVEINYKDKFSRDYWESVNEICKSTHNYVFPSANFFPISDYLSEMLKSPVTIYSGETADSYHNFGFSQFLCYYHDDEGMKEYGDKMHCSLVGPTFFKKVVNNSFRDDSVFKFLRLESNYRKFRCNYQNVNERKKYFILPFIFGSLYDAPRIPFADTIVNPMITNYAKKSLENWTTEEYLKSELEELNEENIYSVYNKIYHKYHCQGGTVNIHRTAFSENRHSWRLPYDDLRLNSFLERMPENWGRGLEIRPAKYPLKRYARGIKDLNTEVIESGAHDFDNSEIRTYSLHKETVYRSFLKPYFKEKIHNSNLLDCLEEKYFKKDYIYRLIAMYSKDELLEGQDFRNLLSIITLCTTGVYS